MLQTLTELDEDATIVSVDGIGAYDGRQCSMDCSQLNGESNFSLSSGVSTVHHQHIYGKMRWAPTTEYCREKGGNKETP